MKVWTLAALVAVAILTNNHASAVQLQKLDESTKEQVKKAAAAALKVAVAAKEADHEVSMKKDKEEIQKAETKETSSNINEQIEKASAEEEKRAVEKAVAHVERIRQKKLEAHEAALK